MPGNTDTKKRCPWVNANPSMVRYHDREWGVPVRRDRKMFEFLVLEGMQAGLSWEIVLNKRENFRAAFDRFDPTKVARYDRRRIERLLRNEGIIRNRLKVEATVHNARRFLDVREEFGSFCRYLWRFVDGRPIQNHVRKMSDYVSRTAESDAMSRDLKQRGFKFVGSTICYAHMQATGMVNDHTVGCFRYGEI